MTEPQPTAAIVGGGPAGLIAAEVLSAAGVDVAVYEQARSVGRKFLLAGRGGLNMTHSEANDVFLERYGPEAGEGTALGAAIAEFTPTDLRSWSKGLGQPTFEGTSGRVFPEAFRATPLLRSWLQRLASTDVRFFTSHRWIGWEHDGGLRFEHEDEVRVATPSVTIFALGGASWPRVGADGSWVPVFEQAGIEVAPLEAANCGLRVDWSDILRERFAGVPIKNATFWVGDASVRGDAVVTQEGLEGGPIYALGREVREAIRVNGTATLTIDTAPDLSTEALTRRLSKRRPKASVSSWLGSTGVAPAVSAMLRDVTSNQIPNAPDAVAQLLKAVRLPITGLAPIDRAISTAGGVRFEQLDQKLMLRQRPGTFVAGEMLDWDAPTGGYLLQACFSTGVAAAKGALVQLRLEPRPN